MPAASVREDQWLAEIARLTKLHAEGFSTSDAAASTGMSLPAIRTKVAMGIRLGVLQMVGFRDGQAIDGKRCKVPVYRAVKRKK